MAGPVTVDEYLAGVPEGPRLGTIRFPADNRLSTEVVRKIVKVRLDEVAAGG